MIQLCVLKKKMKTPDADYTLDKYDKFLNLLTVFTPKFTGNWSVLLIDIDLKSVRDLVENQVIPDYVDVSVYLPQAKLDTITADHPKLAPKEVTPKEAYLEMVQGIKHLIDKKAWWMLYNAIGPDLPSLQDALTKLDEICEGPQITPKMVQQNYLVQDKVYASDVVAAFMRGDRYRWVKLSKLTRDLGDEYAYNAIYKQVKTLLHDKHEYLQNRDTKSKLVDKVDAPKICYAYVLFANSSGYKDLHAVMYDFDKRCLQSLERSLYVNLQ